MGCFFAHSYDTHKPHEYEIDALLPKQVPPEAFDWIIAHLSTELKANVTQHAFEPVSNADVLLFTRIAAFLKIAISKDEQIDSNHSLLPKTCDLARKILDAALQHTDDGDLDSIFQEDASLKSIYDSIFDAVLPQRTLPRPQNDFLLQSLKKNKKEVSTAEASTPT